MPISPDFAFSASTIARRSPQWRLCPAARLSADELVDRSRRARGPGRGRGRRGRPHERGPWRGGRPLRDGACSGGARAPGGSPALDPDGIDLAQGEETARLDFPQRVADGPRPCGAMLVDLARAHARPPAEGGGVTRQRRHAIPAHLLPPAELRPCALPPSPTAWPGSAPTNGPCTCEARRRVAAGQTSSSWPSASRTRRRRARWSTRPSRACGAAAPAIPAGAASPR